MGRDEGEVKEREKFTEAILPPNAVVKLHSEASHTLRNRTQLIFE